MLNDGRKLESHAWALTEHNGTELNELIKRLQEANSGQVKNKNEELKNSGAGLMCKLAREPASLMGWIQFTKHLFVIKFKKRKTRT